MDAAEQVVGHSSNGVHMVTDSATDGIAPEEPEYVVLAISKGIATSRYSGQ